MRPLTPAISVLSVFDYSGEMVRPWHEAGHHCLCVDIQHPRGLTKGGWWRLGADVRDGCPVTSADIAFFFPPCTHLAVSGARWFKGKGLRALSESIELFAVCVEWAEQLGCPYMIENPVSTISRYWREPDYTFDPCDYGDPYTKRTCLWVGGGFVMPPVISDGDLFDAPTVVPPTDGSRMHKLPPSDERANLRSKTPSGFARAVFEANCKEPVCAP